MGHILNTFYQSRIQRRGVQTGTSSTSGVGGTDVHRSFSFFSTRYVESTSVDVPPRALDREDGKGTDSTLCFSTSPASSETRVEVCDHIGVTDRVRGMISDDESETRRSRPWNRRSIEWILSLRWQVNRFFFAFLGFSRSLRGPSPRAPPSTTVR